MSNQVFSGNAARFFPGVEQQDRLTLKKNNAGPPAFGDYPIPLSTTGGGVRFNRLNGVDLTAILGRWPYEQAQSPSTKPYWQLTSSPLLLGSSILLTSITNNTVAVSAVVPGYVTSSPPGLATVLTVKLCLFLMDSVTAFDQARVVAVSSQSNSYDPAVVSPIPITYALNATVDMAPGQVLALMVFTRTSGSDWGFTMIDDTNTLSRILIECAVTFSKV